MGRQVVGYTLDAGALVAAEKNSEAMWALLKLAVEKDLPLTVPACVVAQVWRKRSVQIARLLKACEIEALGEELAKKVGHMLGDKKTADVVDAAVVVGALGRGDAVITADRKAIERLGKVFVIDV